jgi:hypothetical protein
MKELKTEIEIDAPPNAVWQVLTDFASFPSWNPFIREARGELTVGGRLFVRLEPPGARGMVFQPRVLVRDDAHELRWLGKLGIRGLFDGEHIFSLEPLEGGRTRFVQRELFSGLLVPLFSRMLDGSTRQGFEAMNQALKQRVERTPTPPSTDPARA